MKSIKEKQHLVNLAKALGQNADPNLIKEINSFNSIKKDAHESIKRSALKDLTEAFRQAKLENEVQQIIEYPLPPTLDEVLTILEEETPTNELVQPQTEEAPVRESETTNPEPTLAERAAKVISEAPKKDSFQQPDPDPVEKNFAEIQRKLKFLEATIGKIAVAGPGSGETKFRMLDDVDRSSIGNTDQVLRWNPDPRGDAYGKFFFGQLSGDQGPIRSMRYDTSGYGANANVLPGITAWNPVEDCLNVTQGDGSTLQVGLENYIRVYNNTPNTFANGTFVEFIGVDAEGDAPIFRAYVNNANAQPLYSIGVLTTDIASNTHGRATCLGLVRDINTSGNAVGEVWSAGDILWANPYYPGKFTKHKPTSPNVAIAVAAVTVANVTNGIILVRPALWPRLRYGDFFSTLPQTAPAPNQDVQLAISNTLISSGFTLTNNTVVALDSGLYKFQTRIQVTSSSSSSKSLVLWYKRNGVNIERSSVRQSIAENGGYRTITNFQIVSLNAGDNVSVHFAVTDTALTIDSPPVADIFAGAPPIPSIQIAITEAAL